MLCSHVFSISMFDLTNSAFHRYAPPNPNNSGIQPSDERAFFSLAKCDFGPPSLAPPNPENAGPLQPPQHPLPISPVSSKGLPLSPWLPLGSLFASSLRRGPSCNENSPATSAYAVQTTCFAPVSSFFPLLKLSTLPSTFCPLSARLLCQLLSLRRSTHRLTSSPLSFCWPSPPFLKQLFLKFTLNS